MDDTLVLLTSYFNLTNGRRQDTADTLRVDASVPSQTSPDGTAALYIVTESSTGGHMGPRVRRLVADTVAWEYSAHGDEPPATRLKAALRTAHEEILREFDGHVSVGGSVIAVEHTDVYLAQVAPAQVYVLHEGSLHSISATVGGPAPFAHALGATTGPQISVFRDEIAPEDVLALCSSWFHRTADPDDLRECFGAGTADDIAECVLDLGKQLDVRDAQVIVIEVARASELDSRAQGGPQSFMEQVDTAVQALASVGRMFVNELRSEPPVMDRNGHAAASVSSPAQEADIPVSPATPTTGFAEQSTTEIPHVSPQPAKSQDEWNPDDTAAWDVGDLQRSGRSAERSRRLEHATEEVPAVSADTVTDGDAWDDEIVPEGPLLHESEPGVKTEFESFDDAETFDGEHPGTSSPIAERHGASELDEVNSRIQNDPDIGDALPPVQTFPDTSTEPSRIYASSKDIQAVNRRPRRFGGISRPIKDSTSSTPVLRPGLSDIDLRKPVSRAAPPALVWFSAAVVLLFAVVAAYYIVRKHNHGGVAANPYPARFVRNILSALAATSSSTQDAYLTKAREDIALSRQDGDTPADLRRLQSRLTTATNTIYHITVEGAPVLIARFQQASELAVSPDTIYVLDAAKKGVFSVPPNTNSSATEIIQPGEQDSGFTFSTPAHIATSGATALVFDGQTLVRYTGGTKTATSLSPPSPNERIVAMANFGPDVYLLDAAGNQVWRYPDAVQGYNPVAGGFFSPNTTSVTSPASFALDDKDMYILKANGQIVKFDTQQANPQPFTTILRTPLQKADDIFTDVGLTYLWVADPGNARIVQLDKSGKYIRSYVAAAGTGMDLGHIKGIAVPPSGKTLYILTSSALYSFPVTP